MQKLTHSARGSQSYGLHWHSCVQCMLYLGPTPTPHCCISPHLLSSTLPGNPPQATCQCCAVFKDSIRIRVPQPLLLLDTLTDRSSSSRIQPTCTPMMPVVWCPLCILQPLIIATHWNCTKVCSSDSCPFSRQESYSPSSLSVVYAVFVTLPADQLMLVVGGHFHLGRLWEFHNYSISTSVKFHTYA